MKEHASAAESSEVDDSNSGGDIDFTNREWLQGAAKAGEFVGNDQKNVVATATRTETFHQSTLEGGTRAAFMNKDMTTVKTESREDLFERPFLLLHRAPEVNNATFRDTFEMDYRGRVLVDDFLMAIPKGSARSPQIVETPGFSLEAEGEGRGCLPLEIAAGRDGMTACSSGDGMAHFGRLAKNLTFACLNQQKKVKPFKRPHKKGVGQPMIAIQMGRQYGAGELAGYTVGSWLGRSFKDPGKWAPPCIR